MLVKHLLLLSKVNKNSVNRCTKLSSSLLCELNDDMKINLCALEFLFFYRVMFI